MKPLAGLRIADFTVHAAGPFCTHLLSQLGAECIKVESALRADIFRKPHPVYGRLGPATFDQVASNKRSVRLNLKCADGVELARRLVSLSDVAAESFRPGVMMRLGLGFDDLTAMRPGLIMVSISSSGQTGPEAHFAGYAPLFGAWSSLGYLTGYADGPPVELRHVMDHSVGMHAAMATLAALHYSRATGCAQHVDVAGREVAASLAGDALLYAAAGETPTRQGNDHGRMAPHGVYPLRRADRWLTIAVGSDAEWSAFVRVAGDRALDDPRFATETSRHAHRRELDELVAGWTAQRDDGVAEQLQRAGVAAHVSWTVADIVADEHLRSRGSIVGVRNPDGSGRAAVGVPARFSKTSDVGIERGTPALGEDEDYVFGELLGLGEAERRQLEERQVIY
jgi:crotonobetainyl-CoA:carnitine CoA-transferase CaiB-like acyl-CoA transferase